MKHVLLGFLLVAVVSGQEDQAKISKELSEFMKSITENLKNISKSLSNDTTFGDVSNFFKSTKVSKRDVNSNDNNLLTMKAELKRKCNIYGSPENYPSVEMAIDNFDRCINVVARRIQKDKMASTTAGRSANTECRYSSEAKTCFVNYTDALRPCLPRYKGGYFPFADISQAVIDYLCMDQRAQERTKSFVENGTTCIYSNMAQLEECLNATFPSGSYPKIEENAYLFSEENCRKLTELKICVKTELQKCSPSVVTFLEGLNNAVEKFYAPCPTEQKHKEMNIIPYTEPLCN